VEESWPWRVIAGLADEARCEVSDDGGSSIVIVKRVPSLR
jgi:hypothetical protein